MQNGTMRRRILPLILPVALVVACSKSEPPAASKAPAAQKKAPEAPPPPPTPVRTQGELPRGFPYAIMEEDLLRDSSSFTADGIVHYEVGLESPLPPEEVADHWEKQLEKNGVQVVRQRVEEEDHVRIVLLGEDPKGVFSRVSIVHNTTVADDGEKALAKIGVYVGKR